MTYFSKLIFFHIGHTTLHGWGIYVAWSYNPSAELGQSWFKHSFHWYPFEKKRP